MKNRSNQPERTMPRITCPACGSADVGLWNALKKTYHCHFCDNYFTHYGRIVDSAPSRSRSPERNSRGGSPNGFTDPDDFPTDGFNDSGW